MHLNDFSDRLSPMLVKELRQGLRTRSFIGVFLTLQVVLGIILLAAGSTGSSDIGDSISNTILIFFSIAVLLIQPMRGMGALSSEIKGNTIDMMVLTRLSAWKIVTGKWFAIVSQSALMLVTIVPYLILRYFFGGMNLVAEMVLLALIFLTSAGLTAITVGLSAANSVILRSILPVVALPFGSLFLLGAMMSSHRGGSFSDICALDTAESRIAVSSYVASCSYIGYFLLAVGTSLIAPLSENHSTLRRLIALGVTILAVILSIAFVDDYEALMPIFLLVLIPPFVINLSEFGSLAPPVYERFVRHGLFGKIAGFFLFPGWASGVFFSLLLALVASIAFILLFISNPYADEVVITAGLIGVAALLFPALLLKVFKLKGSAQFSNYILILVASGVLSMVLYGISESTSNPEFLWLFVWIPPVMFSMLDSRVSDDVVMIASSLVTATYFGILLVFAVRQYRESMRSVQQSYEHEE